jgi:hypothetical protein
MSARHYPQRTCVADSQLQSLSADNSHVADARAFWKGCVCPLSVGFGAGPAYCLVTGRASCKSPTKAAVLDLVEWIV